MKPYARLNLANAAVLAGVCLAGLALAYGWERIFPSSTTAPRLQAAPDGNQVPMFREIRTPQGTLLEMRVAVDPLGIGLHELQTCYVWRDAVVTGSASISCPQAPAPHPGE